MLTMILVNILNDEITPHVVSFPTLKDVVVVLFIVLLEVVTTKEGLDPQEISKNNSNIKVLKIDFRIW